MADGAGGGALQDRLDRCAALARAATAVKQPGGDFRRVALGRVRDARADVAAAAQGGAGASLTPAGDAPLSPEAALTSLHATLTSASLLALIRDAPPAARVAALASVRDKLQPWTAGSLVLATPEAGAAGNEVAAALAELATAWRSESPVAAAQAHGLLLRLAAARSSRTACILAAGAAIDAPWPLDAEEWPLLRAAALAADVPARPTGRMSTDNTPNFPVLFLAADAKTPAPGACSATALLTAAAAFPATPGPSVRGVTDALLALAVSLDDASLAPAAKVLANAPGEAMALLAAELRERPPSTAQRGQVLALLQSPTANRGVVARQASHRLAELMPAGLTPLEQAKLLSAVLQPRDESRQVTEPAGALAAALAAALEDTRGALDVLCAAPGGAAVAAAAAAAPLAVLAEARLRVIAGGAKPTGMLSTSIRPVAIDAGAWSGFTTMDASLSADGRTLTKTDARRGCTVARGATTFEAGTVAAWRVRVPAEARCRHIFLGVTSPAAVAGSQRFGEWPSETSVVMRSDANPGRGGGLAIGRRLSGMRYTDGEPDRFGFEAGDTVSFGLDLRRESGKLMVMCNGECIGLVLGLRPPLCALAVLGEAGESVALEQAPHSSVPPSEARAAALAPALAVHLAARMAARSEAAAPEEEAALEAVCAALLAHLRAMCCDEGDEAWRAFAAHRGAAVMAAASGAVAAAGALHAALQGASPASPAAAAASHLAARHLAPLLDGGALVMAAAVERWKRVDKRNRDIASFGAELATIVDAMTAAAGALAAACAEAAATAAASAAVPGVAPYLPLFAASQLRGFGLNDASGGKWCASIAAASPFAVGGVLHSLAAAAMLFPDATEAGARARAAQACAAAAALAAGCAPQAAAELARDARIKAIAPAGVAARAAAAAQGDDTAADAASDAARDAAAERVAASAAVVVAIARAAGEDDARGWAKADVHAAVLRGAGRAAACTAAHAAGIASDSTHAAHAWLSTSDGPGRLCAARLDAMAHMSAAAARAADLKPSLLHAALDASPQAGAALAAAALAAGGRCGDAAAACLSGKDSFARLLSRTAGTGRQVIAALLLQLLRSADAAAADDVARCVAALLANAAACEHADAEAPGGGFTPALEALAASLDFSSGNEDGTDAEAAEAEAVSGGAAAVAARAALATPEACGALLASLPALSARGSNAMQRRAVACLHLLGAAAQGSHLPMAPLREALLALSPERLLLLRSGIAAQAALARCTDAAALCAWQAPAEEEPDPALDVWEVPPRATVSEDGTVVTVLTGNASNSVLLRASRGHTRGVHFWTVTLTSHMESGLRDHHLWNSIGVVANDGRIVANDGRIDDSDDTARFPRELMARSPASWCICLDRCYNVFFGGDDASEYLRKVRARDVIGVLLNLEAGVVEFWLNGKLLRSGRCRSELLRHPAAPVVPMLELGARPPGDVYTTDWSAPPPAAMPASTRDAVARTRAEIARGADWQEVSLRAAGALRARRAVADALMRGTDASGQARLVASLDAFAKEDSKATDDCVAGDALCAAMLLGGAPEATLTARGAAALAAAGDAAPRALARCITTALLRDDGDAPLHAALRARLAKAAWELAREPRAAAALADDGALLPLLRVAAALSTASAAAAPPHALSRAAMALVPRAAEATLPMPSRLWVQGRDDADPRYAAGYVPLQLSEGGTRAAAPNECSKASARSDVAAPATLPLYYYEMTLDAVRADGWDYGNAELGFCTPRRYSAASRVSDMGWGLCLCDGTTGIHETAIPGLVQLLGGRTIGAGDTVGAGILWPAGDIFFTLNGAHTGVVYRGAAPRKGEPVYPCVSLHRASVARVNFGPSAGGSPFMCRELVASAIAGASQPRAWPALVGATTLAALPSRWLREPPDGGYAFSHGAGDGGGAADADDMEYDDGRSIRLPLEYCGSVAAYPARGRGRVDTVAANAACPRDLPVFYYEITIEPRDDGAASHVSLGFALGEAFRRRALPGLRRGTWGFHGENGTFHADLMDDEFMSEDDSGADDGGGGAAEPDDDMPNMRRRRRARSSEPAAAPARRQRRLDGPPGRGGDVNARSFGPGDTVGTGVLWPSGDIFFTKNGMLLEVAFPGAVPPGSSPLVPVLGMKRRDTVRVNFGLDAAVPFAFQGLAGLCNAGAAAAPAPAAAAALAPAPALAYEAVPAAALVASPKRWVARPGAGAQDEVPGPLLLWDDGVVCAYHGDNRVCISVVADAPVPQDGPGFYYEVYIERSNDHLADQSIVCIGLTTADGFDSDSVPGWRDGAWGYHSDDGKRHAFYRDEQYGPTFGAGDTAGAGVAWPSGDIFFTKNGLLLGTAFHGETPRDRDVYPMLGLQAPDVVRVNFGTDPATPFKFEGLEALLPGYTAARAEAAAGARTAVARMLRRMVVAGASTAAADVDAAGGDEASAVFAPREMPSRAADAALRLCALERAAAAAHARAAVFRIARAAPSAAAEALFLGAGAALASSASALLAALQPLFLEATPGHPASVDAAARRREPALLRAAVGLGALRDALPPVAAAALTRALLAEAAQRIANAQQCIAPAAPAAPADASEAAAAARPGTALAAALALAAWLLSATPEALHADVAALRAAAHAAMRCALDIDGGSAAETRDAAVEALAPLPAALRLLAALPPPPPDAPDADAALLHDAAAAALERFPSASLAMLLVDAAVRASAPLPDDGRGGEEPDAASPYAGGASALLALRRLDAVLASMEARAPIPPWFIKHVMPLSLSAAERPAALKLSGALPPLPAFSSVWTEAFLAFVGPASAEVRPALDSATWSADEDAQLLRAAVTALPSCADGGRSGRRGRVRGRGRGRGRGGAGDNDAPLSVASVGPQTVFCDDNDAREVMAGHLGAAASATADAPPLSTASATAATMMDVDTAPGLVPGLSVMLSVVPPPLRRGTSGHLLPATPPVPLAQRPPRELACRLALLQRLSALAAPVAHLLLSPAGMRTRLGRRLHAAKGRLAPELAAAALARFGAGVGSRGPRVKPQSVVLSRPRAAAARRSSHALVAQAEAALRDVPFAYGGERAFRVNLEGEAAVDQGGPFRDIISSLGAELCPDDAAGRAAPAYRLLRLFGPTPNATATGANAAQDGTYGADCYMPLPCGAAGLTPRQTQLFKFVGRLIGCSARVGDPPLPLTLAPPVWKALLGERYDGLSHLAATDAREASRLSRIAACAEADWPPGGTPVMWQISDGSGGACAVPPGKLGEAVTWAQRRSYAAAAAAAHAARWRPAAEAMRAGLARELPASATALLTWRQLERAACGSRIVSIAVLRDMVDESGLEGRPQREWLWRTLEGFTDARRAQFLAFSTGRSRAPEKPQRGQLRLTMYVDTWLPHASTCASTFCCAAAPSEERLATGLAYALDNACGIHGDGNLREERHAAGDTQEEEEEEAVVPAQQAAAAAGGALLQPLFDDGGDVEADYGATEPQRGFFDDDSSDSDEGGAGDESEHDIDDDDGW